MWRSSDCTRDSVYVKAIARLSKAHYTDCCCQLVLLCLFSGAGIGSDSQAGQMKYLTLHR